VLAQIRAATSKPLRVEHVGGTSLPRPVGKGDLDIYVGCASASVLRLTARQLISVFGVPANRTERRIRFNFFIDGIEVEIQVVDLAAVTDAVAFREYLRKHPKEARQYGEECTAVRRAFLASLMAIKLRYMAAARSAGRR
jgi:GrpB-like predicted nucleotidyltransferase (UPF0157 family)